MNGIRARAGDAPSSPGGPPWVGTALDVRRAMHCVVLAALPCTAMAIYDTGLQANRAIAGGAAAVAGWREAVLRLLGVGHRPGSVLDCALLGALQLLPLLVASVVAGLAVEQGFARLRGRRPDHVALPVICLLFTLALPPTLPPWLAAVGCGAGIFFGKEIFGGFGRNFVNPAVAGLAFLYFAWPGAFTGAVWVAADGVTSTTPLAAAGGGTAGLVAAGYAWRDAALGTVPGALGETSALACAAGVAWMVYAGVASWRIVAGGLLGLFLGVALLQGLAPTLPSAGLPWHWHLVLGGFAFGLGFLATDPVTAAVTPAGRWLQGLLVGMVTVLVRVAHPAHEEGILLALLMGNVAAPLLDRLAARALLARHGWRRVG